MMRTSKRWEKKTSNRIYTELICLRSSDTIQWNQFLSDCFQQKSRFEVFMKASLNQWINKNIKWTHSFCLSVGCYYFLCGALVLLFFFSSLRPNQSTIHTWFALNVHSAMYTTWNMEHDHKQFHMHFEWQRCLFRFISRTIKPQKHTRFKSHNWRAASRPEMYTLPLFLYCLCATGTHRATIVYTMPGINNHLCCCCCRHRCWREFFEPIESKTVLVFFAPTTGTAISFLTFR